jgi:hypothetical protein
MVLWWRIAQWAVALLGGVAAPTGIAPLARWACPPPEPQAAQGPSQVPDETVWVGGEGRLSLRLWGRRRLAVHAEAGVSFDTDSADEALHDAVSCGGGRWLFVSAHAAWTSDTFLGPIRPLARLEGPVTVVSRVPARVIVRDGHGAYFAWVDGALVAQPAPRDSFAIAFFDVGFGLALTQGGDLWRTDDAGAHWARIDLGAHLAWRLRLDYRGVLVSLLEGRALLVTRAGEHFPTRDVPDGESARRTGLMLQPDARALATASAVRSVAHDAAPRMSAAHTAPTRSAPLPEMTVRIAFPTRHPAVFAERWRRVVGFVGATARRRAARVAETRRQPWRVLATREERGVLEEILLREGFEDAPTRWAVYAWRVSPAGQVLAERGWVGDGPRAAVGIAGSGAVDSGGIHLEMDGPEPGALLIPWRGSARTVPRIARMAGPGPRSVCTPDGDELAERVWFPRPEWLRVRVQGSGLQDVLNVEALHLAHAASGWCVAAVGGHVAMASPQPLHGPMLVHDTHLARILVTAPSGESTPSAEFYTGPEGHLE